MGSNACGKYKSLGKAPTDRNGADGGRGALRASK